MKIIIIALNTFREAARDKVLYGILFFAILLILFSMVLGRLSLNEEVRVILDVGLFGISLFSILIAIFLGSSLLYKEVEKKTIYTIIPKPIQRYEFLIGKFLGMIATLALQIIIMGAVLVLVLFLETGRTPPLGLGVSLILILAEVSVVTSLAIFFSSFTRPFLSGLFTFGLFVLGRNVDSLELLIPKVKETLLREFILVLTKILPNLNLFYISGKVVEERHVSIHTMFVGVNYLLSTLGYGLLYIILVMFLGAFIFQRRDFI
jgi:ABC-type transport system involved in multi-copper enzyme maturation permease subunit